MWKWFNCYLSGRHDFGVWCEPGSVFLRCVHCGKRSSGWVVDPKAHRHAAASKAAPSVPPTVVAAGSPSRVLPFERLAVR
jgi:hypothetical protein